jgi:hypothetical protein
MIRKIYPALYNPLSMPSPITIILLLSRPRKA